MTLLRKLQQISIFTLSFHDNPARGDGIYNATSEKLQEPNISEFRGMLEEKLAAYVNPIFLLICTVVTE